MIGDGEPHRAHGEVFNWFAVEFWSEERLAKTPRSTRSAVLGQDYRYCVTAEVIFLVKNKSAVINFGLLAIGNINDLPPDICVGEFVTGEIGIGLPLCIEPVPDKLILKMGRQWQVEGLSADLTPRTHGIRDSARIAYKEVISTQETKALDYVLHCKELGPSTEPYPVSPLPTMRPEGQ